MPPYKQPDNLIYLCVKSCIELVNSACFIIEKTCLENELQIQEMANSVKNQLMLILPARCFDVLCSERTCCLYSGDPRIQLQILTHPKLTIFRKSDLDNGMTHNFWINTLPTLTKLVVLDLKYICTDEILHVIGVSCPLLQDINIMSKFDICKSPFNASVLIRNVSDSGLMAISNLKQLRVVAMDAPRNNRATRIGRCVSQTGIIMLIKELPNLEELQIEACDIGSLIVCSGADIGPLRFQKINRHFASVDGVRKLVKLCPLLEEFSLTHLSDTNKDDILDQIALSDLRLRKLDLLFFTYTQSLYQLLVLKGSYLTHFSLCEVDVTLNVGALITIGSYCPHLTSLSLVTHSRSLVVSPYYKQTKKMFTELESLTLGCANFDIAHTLRFFLSCTQNLQKLTVKCQTKTNINNMMLKLLSSRCLKKIKYLWLDCTLGLSKEVVKQVIQCCDSLQMFTFDFPGDMTDLQKYIKQNNWDLKLDGSYSY